MISTPRATDNVLDPARALGQQIDALVSGLMGEQRHICLIDPPDYPNVGDHAIFLGELAFLNRRYPQALVSFYDVNSYSSRADHVIERASILLLQGGGNFGDIWPHHHSLRTRILERFPHKQIIQLPQSIHFSSPSELQRTAELIRKQCNFTLLVRDTRSLKFAAEHFECATELCPDMAFAMDPIERTSASADAFCLLRTDKEAAADHAEILRTLNECGLRYSVGDWLIEPATLIKRFDRQANRITLRRPRLTAPLRDIRLEIRRRYAEQSLKRGMAMLNTGRIVVTDRLHAHIISCLLGIPNIIFNSWDGKVAAFHETWTKGRFNAVMADTPADLIHCLDQIETATVDA